MDERIHFLDFFFFDEPGRIKVLHFAGNLSIIAGRIKSRDPADTGLTGTNGIPRLLDAGTQRSHQPKTGDNDAPGRPI